MRSTAAAGLLVTLLACTTACKKGGAPAEADASASLPALTAGDFCETVFGAAARQLSARCTPDDQQRKQHGYLVGLTSGSISRCKEELEPLVARGSVRLDAEAARRCAKHLEATSWKETLASADVSRFPECRGLVLGTVTEGQPCASGVECGAGLVCARGDRPVGQCEKPGGAAPACARSLVQGLAAPGSCGPGATCRRGLRAPTALGAPAAESAEAFGDGTGGTAKERALRAAAEFGLIGLGDPSAGARGIDAVDRPAGLGPGASRGLGQRAKAPRVRMGATLVSGRLPPEVIQRIVRQSFGRFRLCYENGLREDPGLAGRVSPKFVIGRDGHVSAARDGGSDLPNQDVVACIVRAFSSLVFPAPDGGIVTVTFPLLFSPPEEADAGAAPAPVTPPPATAAPDAGSEPATCAPALPAGADCTARDACADGLACRVHRCSINPPAGPGGACLEEDDCGPGLDCKRTEYGASDRGACAARKPEGAACASSLQCGGICLAGKCAAFCGAR